MQGLGQNTSEPEVEAGAPALLGDLHGLTSQAFCSWAMFLWLLACSLAQSSLSSFSCSWMVSEAGWFPCSSLCPSCSDRDTYLRDTGMLAPGFGQQPKLLSLCTSYKFLNLPKSYFPHPQNGENNYLFK